MKYIQKFIKIFSLLNTWHCQKNWLSLWILEPLGIIAHTIASKTRGVKREINART